MGWQALLEILAENRQEVEQENTRRPAACPNDGSPLEQVNGILHCRFDGWTWPLGADPTLRRPR